MRATNKEKEIKMMLDIGLMIGLYITTKMTLLLAKKKEESVIVIMLAIVTIFITWFCLYDLLIAGERISSILNDVY